MGSLRTFNNFKNADLKSVAGAELAQTGMNILRGQNTQSTVFVPTSASVTDGLSKAIPNIPGVKIIPTNSSVPNMNTQNNQNPPASVGTIFL